MWRSYGSKIINYFSANFSFSIYSFNFADNSYIVKY